MAEALGDPGLQFVQCDLRDGGQILAFRLRDRQPHQFDQFAVRTDLAFDAVRDGAGIDREEPGVSTMWLRTGPVRSPCHEPVEDLFQS